MPFWGTCLVAIFYFWRKYKQQPDSSPTSPPPLNPTENIRTLFLEKRKKIKQKHVQHLDDADELAKRKASAAAKRKGQAFADMNEKTDTFEFGKNAVTPEDKEKFDIIDCLHPTADYLLDTKIYVELLEQVRAFVLDWFMSRSKR
jgi:hypothetical protein